MAPDANLAERREPLDLRPRTILAVGLGTLAFLVVALGCLWLFETWMGMDRSAGPARTFPPPRLQSDPAGELRAYEAEQRTLLESYAWADRDRSLVRIPVARAMDMIAARGADAYAPLDPPRWPDPRR
jgi:hypothetical protein